MPGKQVGLATRAPASRHVRVDWRRGRFWPRGGWSGSAARASGPAKADAPRVARRPEPALGSRPASPLRAPGVRQQGVPVRRHEEVRLCAACRHAAAGRLRGRLVAAQSVRRTGHRLRARGSRRSCACRRRRGGARQPGAHRRRRWSSRVGAGRAQLLRRERPRMPRGQHPLQPRDRRAPGTVPHGCRLGLVRADRTRATPRVTGDPVIRTRRKRLR